MADLQGGMPPCSNELKWYREPWPWLLISVPAVSLVLGIAMLVLAARTHDGLVVDDYYKQGLGINRLMDREARARSLGLRATLAVDADRGTLRIVLEGKQTPERISVKLVHPTRAGADYALTLAHIGGGAYQGVVRDVPTGRWHVLLEDAAGTWRMAGVWHADTPMTLQAVQEEQR